MGVQAVSYARTVIQMVETRSGTVLSENRPSEYHAEAAAEDLTTINKIAVSVFHQIATNFSFTEILNYAKDFQKYKVGETLGFPNTRYSKMLSGVGSTEIADTLASNVAEVLSSVWRYRLSGIRDSKRN